MDQVVSDRLRAQGHLERIVAALGAGVILLDSDREIAWMDKRTRARLNGGMEQLAATLRALNTSGGINCCLSAQEVMINGEAAIVCLIQENEVAQDEHGYDAIAAIEAAMADTSWFTRTIIEKLKALRQTKQPAPRISDMEVLTDREREVLGLICEGRSDAQMSAMLNLSQNTVRNHIASLYRKIGVNRRSAAIIWARERAITPQDALGLRRRTRPRASHPHD
jgi:DNA-binding CsgD family transcriptional regulator